ncbi:cysteine proteinase [Fistulina hepatica ATCC 64428]|uniref:Cysteine proteinase n=1 Tax=Fistulina hepatica ATCC 64428 TaxID=1128425 RepID=A0A0D7A3G5_9AGAR|nr:cysteine proteinase [Fistulina hepatica ATCC 64428]
MGSNKRAQKRGRPQPHCSSSPLLTFPVGLPAVSSPLARYKIDQNKGPHITVPPQLVSDPAENNQLLTELLRNMGLYAAPTLGDGNCLFRALSDQVYGSPSMHAKVRQDVCDWIERHFSRYAPFTEDERGLTVHLGCMRQNGTYGGHMELSAFSHMMRRNIKVIQPTVVYVIEWAKFKSDDDGNEPGPSNASTDSSVNGRRVHKGRMRIEKDNAIEAHDDSQETIYVAYHDWEHFSSIRNLKGPHSGLPYVLEAPVREPGPLQVEQVSAHRKKPLPKVKLRLSRPPAPVEPTPSPPSDPLQIPLPSSRSASPVSTAESSLLPPSSLPSTAPSSQALPRTGRSPKRSFDESSLSTDDDHLMEGLKRSRRSSPCVNPDDGSGTPELSTPGSSSSSTSSLSEIEDADEDITSESRSPSPPPQPVSRPLTRRQRKALGLPKPRAGAGKIIIPGGRHKLGRLAATPLETAGGDTEQEWQRNGTGRVDVRGFRELKI